MWSFLILAAFILMVQNTYIFQTCLSRSKLRFRAFQLQLESARRGLFIQVQQDCNCNRRLPVHICKTKDPNFILELTQDLGAMS